MPRRRTAALLAALLLALPAACKRGGGDQQASAAANAADSTAETVQKRDTLPTGVTVDTQKVDSATGGRETPQQDQDDAP
jgi:hypothetical protein